MNQTLAQQELDFLAKIQVLSFTANPNRVKPFGKTTLSWNVRFPPGPHAPVTLQVGGRAAAPSGSMTFAVSADTEFEITASMAVIKQSVLGSVQVTVDDSECRVESFPASVLTFPIQQNITAAFTGHLAGTVQVGPPGAGGSLPIQIPIEGGLTISIELSMGLGDNQMVAVFRDSVDASVSAGIDPEGCGDKVKSVAIAFMTHIVDSEMVPQIAQALNGQIQQVAASATSSDRLHRQFALTSFSLTADGISFTLCPTTPGIVVGPGSVLA
jgi:hypothetical protein